MTTKRKRAATPKKPETTEDIMLQAVGAYLKEKGWTVLVIGADRIQGRADAFNYEFVLRFTGKKK
jgi:hypothetical protein